MRILAGAAIILMLSGAAGAWGKLDMGHMKDWVIVVPENAGAADKYAAEEFRSLFEKATGTSLPIKDAAPKGKRNVFIGVPAKGAGLDRDKLGEEGLQIQVKHNNIAIIGGQPRGTLYGVYEFFERYLGARFLTYDDVYFPPRDSAMKVPCERFKYVPPFSFRWPFYMENVEHPDFAARLRVNTVPTDEKLGGKTGQNLINHSLFRWVNTEKYGQSHPEYFALVGGERKLDVGGGGPELCETNPEVIDIVAEGVIKDLDENPAQQNISVSQNDNDAYCRCPKCEEINQREGTPMGAHLALVNAVAERVEKKHPRVKIGTLAYWYTRKAPKTIVPRPNVQVQLCSIECCTLHAIDDPDCPKNRAFCGDMEAWKAICNDIWVWNYNTNFSCYDMPFPNLRSIGANVRFFLNNNVKGVFMQANGNGTSGEMSDLRNYVIARCLWHPGQESWPLVEEFCRLHYKNAAQPILDYLTMIHDNAVAMKLHPNCFPKPQEVGLTPEIAMKAMDYFADAMAKADNDEVRARVEKASICAYKAMLLTGAGDVSEKYIALCRKHHMTMATEGTTAEDYFKTLPSK